MPAIGVVGCGVAGQAAALFLHRAGHRVEIFERFETARPIGAGLLLQPTGLAVLERLGLAAAALEHGAKVRRLLGHSRRGRVVLDVSYRHYRPDSLGLGIQRGTLFGLLNDAVGAGGITITTGAEIAEIETARLLRALDKAGRRHGPFDLVLVADGAESNLRARHGALVRAPVYPYGALWTVCDERGEASDMLRQVYDGPRRMAGILPIGRLPAHAAGTRQVAIFWSLRNDAMAAWREVGLDAWRRELAAHWPEYAAYVDGVVDDGAFLHAKYRDVCCGRRLPAASSSSAMPPMAPAPSSARGPISLWSMPPFSPIRWPRPRTSMRASHFTNVAAAGIFVSINGPAAD